MLYVGLSQNKVDYTIFVPPVFKLLLLHVVYINVHNFKGCHRWISLLILGVSIKLDDDQSED